MKPSREFLKTSGDEELRIVVREVNEGKREEMISLASKNERENGELRAVLEKINFSDWRRIYEQDARRSGISPEGMNFVSLDDILNMPFTPPKGKIGRQLGTYDNFANMIGVDYKQIVEEARRLEVSPGLFLFYNLCHEQTHATARMECVGLGETIMATSGNYSILNGYQQEENTKGLNGEYEVIGTFFEAYNEGVTERYAREEVLFRYLEHHPELGAPAEISQLKKALNRQKGSYELELKLLKAFMLKVSRLSGFDTDAVWRGIIRGNYAGERLDDEEAQRLFHEYFGADFLDRLAALKSVDARIESLTWELNDESSNDASRQLGHRVGTWLRRKLA